MNSAESDVKNFLLGINRNSKTYFTGTTLKNPIEYTVGEEIIFKIWVESDGVHVPVPYIQCYIEGDDGNKSENYIKADADGCFYIHTKLMCDGFVHIIAKACDEEKNIIEGIDVYEGGAGADVDKIECNTDIPDDYTEFWANLKQTAYSIPEEILFKEEIPTDDGFKAYNVRYATPVADYISVVYTYPTDAKPKSLKLMFMNMGYGVSDCPPECKEGYMVVRANTHDILNRQPQEYYDKKAEELSGYGLANREENKKPETSFWYKLYVKDMQIINYFKDHPLANGIDYEFEGGSQAAFQAINLAAHTGLATAVRACVPWFCDIFAIKKRNRIPIAWKPEADEGLRYFDTAVGAKFLKCPVYIEAGLGDYICPPSGQMAMYNSITAPKKLRFVQNRTHPYTPPVIITNELSQGLNIADFKFSY